jgi:hypothetical protein
MKAPRKRRLQVGDFVRERDGQNIGIVICIIRPDLIIARFPPALQGVAFLADDLVKVADKERTRRKR